MRKPKSIRDTEDRYRERISDEMDRADDSDAKTERLKAEYEAWRKSVADDFVIAFAWALQRDPCAILSMLDRKPVNLESLRKLAAEVQRLTEEVNSLKPQNERAGHALLAVQTTGLEAGK